MSEATGPTDAPSSDATGPTDAPSSDATGPVVEPSSDASGPTVEPSSDASGPVVEPSSEATGPTVEPSSDATGPTDTVYVPPPPPPPISIDDLLNSIQVLQQKEAADKSLLESIGNISQEELKTKLIAWAMTGFSSAYGIHTVTIVPPSSCSDGVSRSLTDYILFCSGKTIREHIDVLQQKVTNISVSFANMGSHISIVVSKI